jgi:hypothetical protein
MVREEEGERRCVVRLGSEENGMVRRRRKRVGRYGEEEQEEENGMVW